MKGVNTMIDYIDIYQVYHQAAKRVREGIDSLSFSQRPQNKQAPKYFYLQSKLNYNYQVLF